MMKQLIFVLIICFTTVGLAQSEGDYIEIDGFQIYYVEQGSPDDLTVMLLHGFGGSTFTWRDNINALVEAGYHVVAYDRPPFGLSDKRIDFDMRNEAQAAQAIAFADALEIESAVWVGHSMGGGVVAQIGVDYPERVDGLVFVDGAVQLPDAEMRAEDEGDAPIAGLSEIAANLDPQSPLAQNLVRTFLTEERFIGMLSSAYHPSFEVTDEVAEGYMRMFSVEGWEAAFIVMMTAEREIEPIDVDALMDIPTLIVWGEDDTWVPLAMGERLHEFLPDAEMTTYAETGHMPMEEQVELFNADLVAFLGRLGLK